MRLNAAADLVANGEYTAAEEAYRHIMDVAPDDPAPALDLADLYQTWHRPTDGLTALDAAVARGAAAEQTNTRRLALLAAAGQWRQVSDQAQHILEADPIDLAALKALARAALRRGSCDEARAAETQVLAVAPADAEAIEVAALLDGDLAKLARFAPALVEGLQTCDARCDRAVGLRLVRTGRWDVAACVLARAAEADPRDAEVRAWLGESYARLGRTDAAASYLHAAVELAPDLPQAWLLLGKLALTTGDLDTARAALLNAQQLDPANPAPCLAVAELKARAGRYDEIDRWTQAALDRAPKDVEVWKAVARFYLSRDLADDAVAQAAIAMAVDMAPDDAEVHLLRGWMLVLQGRPDDALEPLDRAIALAPDLAEAYYWQGQALTALGDAAHAQSALTRAADLGYR